MNENFWIYLSFIVMIIVSLKVIILTYITSLDVDNFSLSHHQAWFSGGPGVSLEASSALMPPKLKTV